MKFGKTENAGEIDFTLPPDHLQTSLLLKQIQSDLPINLYVGCAKWNRKELKNFYPRGTKDELTYYSQQFNSIELNATFYSIPTAKQVITWREKTPEEFRFFPKISQRISHFGRLENVDSLVTEYGDAVVNFESRLGMVFLQLHDNFGPKNFNRLIHFVEQFPQAIPLAIELRNTEWFNNPSVSNELYRLFEANRVTNILVDTAGRRDLLHMRLTSPYAFVRYVGANETMNDRKRLDDWIERLSCWIDSGLRNINFFVHQNIEEESPRLADYFIAQANRKFGLQLRRPQLQETQLF